MSKKKLQPSVPRKVVPRKVARVERKCLRCGYAWTPNKPAAPKYCARCKSSYWARAKRNATGPKVYRTWRENGTKAGVLVVLASRREKYRKQRLAKRRAAVLARNVARFKRAKTKVAKVA